MIWQSASWQGGIIPFNVFRLMHRKTRRKRLVAQLTKGKEILMKTTRTIAANAVLGLALSAGAAFSQDCSVEGKAGLAAFDVGADTVLAYVPESALGKPAPLVINLHPSGGTGLRTLAASQKVADENGFIIMAPTGNIGPVFSGWTWNVPGVPSFGGDQYPAEDARNDVEFIAKAIDKMPEIACIDQNRIYAMGFSGGGRMASTLACEMSDRIASVVAIGGIRFSRASDAELGLPKALDCIPGRAIPMQAIHGRWDAVNPWFDEAQGQTPFTDPAKDDAPIEAAAPQQGSSWSYSGKEALERWVEHNGCNPEPTVTQIADGIEERTYQGCTDNAEVSLVFYENLGHAVPGHEEPWSPGQADSPIDGYALGWELLQDDRLPE